MTHSEPLESGRVPPRRIVSGLLVPLAVSVAALGHVAFGIWYTTSTPTTPSGGGAIIGLEGFILLSAVVVVTVAVTLAALVDIGLALVTYRSRTGAGSCAVSGLTAALGLFDLLAFAAYGCLGFGQAVDAVNDTRRTSAHERWIRETEARRYRSEALGVSFAYLDELPPDETYQRPRISVREEGEHLVIVGERREGPLSVYARLTPIEIPAGVPTREYLESLKVGDGCTLDDVSSRGWGDGPIRDLARRHPVYGLHLGSPPYGCRMPRLPDGSRLFGGPIPFDPAGLESRFGPSPPRVSEESRNIYFIVTPDRVWAGLFDGDELPYGPGYLSDPVVEPERWWAGTLRFDSGPTGRTPAPSTLP